MPVPNQSAGAAWMDNGLVLQAMPEIDRDEAGMKYATLKFKTAAANNPSLEPERGTPCPDFVTDTNDAETNEVLDSLDYLAAQTTKWILDGGGPGIDVLEVLCKGGVASSQVDAQKILSVPITDPGADYRDAPSISFINAGVIKPAVAKVHVETNVPAMSVVIANGGTGYVVGQILPVIGGTFAATHPVKLKVEAVGGSGEVTAVSDGDTGCDHGDYTKCPVNPVSVPVIGGSSGAQFELFWQIKSIEIIDGGQYEGTPTAQLTGGTRTSPDTTDAVLGTPNMGDAGVVAGGPTNPFVTKNVTKLTMNDGTNDYTVYAVDIAANYVCDFEPQVPLWLSNDYATASAGQVTIVSPNPISPPITVGIPALYDQYSQPVTTVPATLVLRLELNDLKRDPCGAKFLVTESARLLYAKAPP